jgi:hypothetical protein
MNDANAAKDRIRGLGVTDAFVIAYANGNRVTVSEALEYLKTPENNSTSTNKELRNNTSSSVETNTSTTPPVNGNDTEIDNSTDEIDEVETSTSTETNKVTNSSAEEPVNNTTVPVKKEPIDQVKIGEELNIVFKVLLGEYEDDIPVDEAAVYLKLSGQGMEIKEVEGKSRYTIGAYPDYPSALDKQLEMKEEGIKKPKVIAFKDGIKIEVEEALELVKNNN